MQLKDTNLHYLLNQLGLTYNEAEVYLYLLTGGTKPGADIHGDLKMDKSSCYRSLRSLTEKDLIYTVGEERNRTFTANPPSHIESLVREKEQQLRRTKKSLEEFQSLIQKYLQKGYQDKNITLITSEAGYRQYMENRLRAKSKIVRELSGRATASTYVDNYDEYMTDYVHRRAKGGIFLRQLAPYGGTDDKWEKTSTELNKEVRELPNDFLTPASFSVWDDTVALMSKEKGRHIGVMIKDPLIATLLISMFDFIWNNCPEGRP